MCHRLLIVEDDIALQQMLSWELEDLGYEVATSGNCQVARALFEARHFDIALLDYNLPDGDGVKLLDELRRRRPGLPVVMFSGAGCRETPERALRSGAIHYITKPASAALLHRLFQKAIGETAGAC